MGSELLTNTADFLKELIKRGIGEATHELYREYPEVFRLMETSPSALLIEINGLTISELKSENGDDPKEAIEFLQKNKDLIKKTSLFKNFRLLRRVDSSEIKIYMINVLEWRPGPFGGKIKADFYRRILLVIST